MLALGLSRFVVFTTDAASPTQPIVPALFRLSRVARLWCGTS